MNPLKTADTLIPAGLAILLLVVASSCSTVLAVDEKPKKITVATWNVEWFFDDYTGDNFSDLSRKQSAPSRDEWDWKLNGVAGVIAEMRPDILALQEVENRAVLRQLTKRLADNHGLSYRIAFIEGWDTFTEQDVAVIYRRGMIQYSCREQTAEMFQSKKFYNLNKHVFAEFQWGNGNDVETLTLLNVHLRATAEKHELREKQCRLAMNWLRPALERGGNVVVLGDLNTEEASGSIRDGSDLAILAGVDPATGGSKLFDLHQHLPANQRATHLGGKQHDRILVSASLLSDAERRNDLSFSRIDNFRNLVVVRGPDNNHFENFYGIEKTQRDFSDHYPVMAEFIFR